MAFQLVACLVLSALVVCMAEQPTERAYQHPLTNLPPGGEITTGFYFPEHANKKFPAGDKIKVVLGLHNDATEVYNVTAIMGSLNIPMEFSGYVQNFTQQFYLQRLSPGQQTTVEYTFRPDPSLPAREFVVALTLFYQNSKGAFLSTTFFNQTVDIVEKKKFVDADFIMMYITLAGLLAIAGYGLYLYLLSLGFLKKQKVRTKVSSVSHVSEHPEEWIEGTAYSQFKAQKDKKKAAEGRKKA